MPLDNTIYDYIGRTDPIMPPDPLTGDLGVHRVPGQSVYSVLPFTMDGYAFVVNHQDAGSVHGDLLLVPQRSIFPFMNEIFDEGLRVV